MYIYIYVYVYVYIYICTCVYHMYVYTYIEREREMHIHTLTHKTCLLFSLVSLLVRVVFWVTEIQHTHSTKHCMLLRAIMLAPDSGMLPSVFG